MTEQVKIIAVKAVGDWELDVLAVPYGGPDGGKDLDGEYFSPETNLYLDKFDKPIVSYYHGFDPDGNPQGEPEEIGEVLNIERKSDGVWARVKLNELSEYAKRIWESAKEGLARASSGTIQHIMRTARDGLITHWPFVELALIDTDGSRQPANAYAVAMPVMKAAYKQAGKDWPDIPDTGKPEDKTKGEKQSVESEQDGKGKILKVKGLKMEKEELLDILDGRDERKAAEALASAQSEEERKAEIKTAVDAALELAEKKRKEEAAKKNRLPSNKGDDDIANKDINVAKFAELNKYDNLDIGDQSFMIGILQEAKRTGRSREGASENALKALAIKVVEDKDEDGAHRATKNAMKAKGMPMKSNELNQSTLNNYGDEWVAVSYSAQLWERIRLGVEVASKIPSVVVPQGTRSIHIPVDGASATFYKVAQASEVATNPGSPITRTVTVSKKTTVETSLTVAKMGCAVYYTGELEEDSLIPWASTIRADIQAEGAEVLDHLCIDGDIDTGATTNINTIGGTAGGTEAYLLFDGFRNLALVANTANSRAGGVLDLNDFLETVKLMGLGGKNAIDRSKVSFILDLHTHWKSLELAQVQTKDVFSNPTIEGGMLTSIYGYPVIASANMHRANQNATYGLKANSSGKVDLTTVGNNLYGAMLAVRWDQWRLGFKRRMTFETVRVPSADATEITALMRVGLVYRDTDAAAISYGLTV